MIFTIVVVLCLSVYEIYHMIKKKQKREMIVWIVLAIVAVSFAIYYQLEAYNTSLSILILHLFGIEY